MADLPITSDEGALPVVVNDAVTTANTLAVEADGSITAGSSVAMDVENSKGFSVVSEVLPLAATETAVFLVKNPSGSGKKLKLNLMLLGLLQSVGSATGNQDAFRLYLDPTITANGTALTINNLYSQTGAPATVMTAFFSPTVTANGTKLGTYAVSTQGNGTAIVPQAGTRILDPNHNWLITQTGIVNGAATGIVQMEWIEE